MKPSEILTKARDLLEDKGWTQYSMARDALDLPVSAHDPKAVCFCAMGATSRVVGPDRDLGVIGHEKYMQSAFVTDGHAIAGNNDLPSTTQQHVLMAFDFAILMAESNGE